MQNTYVFLCTFSKRGVLHGCGRNICDLCVCILVMEKNKNASFKLCNNYFVNFKVDSKLVGEGLVTKKRGCKDDWRVSGGDT